VIRRQTRDLSVGDVFDRISTSGVFCEGGVIIINMSGSWVENNVLKDGAESDGVVDIWLFLSGKTDGLCVATTLNVENTTITPAVLVVTDQGTVGVGGQSCLAGTGQTKENGDISILTLICR